MKGPITTLAYLKKDGCYLMLHRIKKKNDMNEHKWLGIGGHLEAGESPEDCLLRECREETGLTLTDYRFVGLVTFTSDKYPDEYMCLYESASWVGELDYGADGEGVLEWVPMEKIPSLNLWQGDLIFFRLMQENIPFFSLKLSYEGDRLVSWQLNGENYLGFPEEDNFSKIIDRMR